MVSVAKTKPEGVILSCVQTFKLISYGLNVFEYFITLCLNKTTCLKKHHHL